MAVLGDGRAPLARGRLLERSMCVPTVTITNRVGGRTRHRNLSVARHLRVLTVSTRIGAVVCAFFGLQQVLIVQDSLWVGFINMAGALFFFFLPHLYRFGDLFAPVAFLIAAYAMITVVCVYIGSGIGMQFYLVAAAAILVLVLGTQHLVVASVLGVTGAVITILVELRVPRNTGTQPDWAFTSGFVVNTVAAWVLVIATVWFSLRETARAEAAMEAEYQRSESLLANILPASVAERLKDPAHRIIADKYDEASVLFADIADYTKRASDTPPTDLVRFLDGLYTDLDALVDLHGLEKVKTSGDSYMVVSGVPEARPDHLEALASLALDMADAVDGLTDARGRAVPLRIGLATGPVVAGVVGARRFFYDVWGDAVNVASRMESTDVAGRIQVPNDVYELLKGKFVFEERGEIEVKGKGLMHTWYLTGRR